MNIIRITDQNTKSNYTDLILRSLPDWFGIETAIQDYVADVKELPFWAAMDQEKCVGFVAGKIHHGHTGDLYVLGVHQDYHNQGVGRALIVKSEDYFREIGCKYAIVKTLDESAGSEHYDRTRKFYLRIGYEPLITDPEVWDEHNPCLIMIKVL